MSHWLRFLHQTEREKKSLIELFSWCEQHYLCKRTSCFEGIEIVIVRFPLKTLWKDENSMNHVSLGCSINLLLNNTVGDWVNLTENWKLDIFLQWSISLCFMFACFSVLNDGQNNVFIPHNTITIFGHWQYLSSGWP